VLELRLSHRTLGEIVGARRPTVTSALGQLREEAKLRPPRRRHLAPPRPSPHLRRTTPLNPPPTCQPPDPQPCANRATSADHPWSHR
jgi:hypothetical protein